MVSEKAWNGGGMSDRCKCGARIMYCNLVDMDDGRELYFYLCGVCGSEIELKVVTDPQRY
jgi:DNA-directed RNA polymerase subunit RPC12/RpoP